MNPYWNDEGIRAEMRDAKETLASQRAEGWEGAARRTVRYLWWLRSLLNRRRGGVL